MPKCNDCGAETQAEDLCEDCWNDSWDNDFPKQDEDESQVVLADPFPVDYDYERADRLCKELTEKCQGNDDGSNVVIIDLGVPPKRK